MKPRHILNTEAFKALQTIARLYVSQFCPTFITQKELSYN